MLGNQLNKDKKPIAIFNQSKKEKKKGKVRIFMDKDSNLIGKSVHLCFPFEERKCFDLTTSRHFTTYSTRTKI